MNGASQATPAEYSDVWARQILQNRLFNPPPPPEGAESTFLHRLKARQQDRLPVSAMRRQAACVKKNLIGLPGGAGGESMRLGEEIGEAVCSVGLDQNPAGASGTVEERV